MSQACFCRRFVFTRYIGNLPSFYLVMWSVMRTGRAPVLPWMRDWSIRAAADEGRVVVYRGSDGQWKREAVSRPGRVRCFQGICLWLSILRRQCDKQSKDRAHRPPNRVRQPILCSGRGGEWADATASAQLPSVRYGSVVSALGWTNSCHA